MALIKIYHVQSDKLQENMYQEGDAIKQYKLQSVAQMYDNPFSVDSNANDTKFFGKKTQCFICQYCSIMNQVKHQTNLSAFCRPQHFGP